MWSSNILVQYFQRHRDGSEDEIRDDILRDIDVDTDTAEGNENPYDDIDELDILFNDDV